MTPLIKIRSERDQMSAIERRIADYVLDNAHLLRDYSSQQLASALGISQSSVVKFSQKLGFKGYPDLKFSIGEALARDGGGDADAPIAADATGGHAALADALWREKAAAGEETRLLNPDATIDAAVDALHGAQRIFVCGFGADGIAAREFALKLAMLGKLALHETDPLPMLAHLAGAGRDDVLVLFSEQGKHAALAQLARQFQLGGGRLLSVTRHTANPLRAQADVALVVSAHSAMLHVEPLLYRAALNHLLDVLFVLLFRRDDATQARFATQVERIAHLLDP
ncbi:MurR/RpiR family transcriptional regulator [Chiayiivirga flava]|uniref:DNA-binding MurR/RpiR family transcriptional regulator n=1 Tax=Chiayiivirga flava TaxID=659595 RepID=A0A7W8G1D7_9GAMM|nr:MurR/RpiR family transcriptional regulator [Chiayiivirga flava]MBB5208763.1 DNA-binding MurR/RpiR family transcriptional regulator [Chiayiivirga flava]